VIAALLAWLARFVSGASVFWTDAPPDAAQRIYKGCPFLVK